MGKTNLYTVTDCQTGKVLVKGTAKEVEASGLMPKGYHARNWAKRENQKRKGRKYVITVEELTPENRRGEKKRMTKQPTLRRIKNPTPLDYDVHDLMTYNAIARKKGRPELTYGYWAAAGKPATPTTAAGNREELLGPRPAGCKRSEADAGSRNPGSL